MNIFFSSDIVVLWALGIEILKNVFGFLKFNGVPVINHYLDGGNPFFQTQTVTLEELGRNPLLLVRFAAFSRHFRVKMVHGILTVLPQ